MVTSPITVARSLSSFTFPHDFDSFVVGKQEVFDEIVQSLSHAKYAGTSGTILNKLFENVIRLSTRMRDTTGISKDVISLGDIAVKLVDEKAGLDSKSIEEKILDTLDSNIVLQKQK